MVAQPKHDDTMSVAEYFDLLRETDNVKYELIDGTVYAMAGASENHILINGNLVTLLNISLRDRPCRVYGSDMQVATVNSYTYPDVSVVCEQPQFVADAPVAMLTNPLLLFEILSPSTAQTDRTTKFDHYRQIATLQDYVLVWQDEPRIDVFSRGESDTWLLTHATELEAAIAMPSLSVTLALSEVYQRVTFSAAGAEE